ncbi:LuxR C-terminal-related transcriptional regulator [Erythrobacter sp. GH1-10]|uniref:LuxR C-terminal-related transcriptional regulator n=1 Tax=Erythrobacter sp. GH1-10 TaxID=3349334 RepID=UPI0038783424
MEVPMPPQAARPLTERQQAVMERIDRRMPIKVIAQELGVSETRINQHIRALKDIFKAESLGELVEEYRATLPEEGQGEASENTKGNSSTGSSVKGLTEPVYSKNQVHGHTLAGIDGSRVDQGELVMSDVLPLIEQAPWLRPGEPKVVPGVLDGEHAVLFRLAAIIGIAFGILAAVVLTVTAAVAISEAMDGRARVPVEQV